MYICQLLVAGFAGSNAATVASCEPCALVLENPADAVSAILEEAAHSDQPLIFSAHSIESYLASRNSQGDAQPDGLKEGVESKPQPARRLRTKSAAKIIQSVVKHYFIEPVTSINNVVCDCCLVSRMLHLNQPSTCHMFPMEAYRYSHPLLFRRDVLKFLFRGSMRIDTNGFLMFARSVDLSCRLLRPRSRRSTALQSLRRRWWRHHRRPRSLLPFLRCVDGYGPALLCSRYCL